MRIVIVGDGKMGRAVAGLAEARGHTIHAMIGGTENAGGRALTPERLKGADVAVEFTQPDAAVANLERLIDAGVPVVTGTTGWRDQLPRITAHVEQRGGALLHAANFSLGVHLFLRAAQDLARRFAGHPEFDAFILEEHHAAKLDAPSGTARELQATRERPRIRRGRFRSPPYGPAPPRDAPRGLRRAIRASDAGARGPEPRGLRGGRPGRGRVAARTPRRLHGRGHALRREWMTGFEGCGTALVTPFTESGAVDFLALGALVEWQIAEGIDFLVPCGSTGEAQTLDDGERERVVAAVVETAAGRVPVVAGATSNDTRRAVEETRRMCASASTASSRPRPTTTSPRRRASPGTSRPSPTPPSARSASTTSPAAPPSISSRPPRFAWPSIRTCAASRRRAATCGRSWRSSATVPRASPCSRVTTGWRSRSPRRAARG